MREIKMILFAAFLFPMVSVAEIPTETISADSPSADPVDSILTEEMIRTLRDPFRMPKILAEEESPKTELELFQVKDYRLNGVITGPNKVRAMVTAPNGKSYFIRQGQKIGTRGGKIVSILPDKIKIIEYDMDERGRKVPETFEMRLNGEVVSVSKKSDDDY